MILPPPSACASTGIPVAFGTIQLTYILACLLKVA
jgi:hypothetical protein